MLNRAYSIITNKDDLTKENVRIKQSLKENEYQESIISKIFKRIANNPILFQSPLKTQATYIQKHEIKMSINLLCVEGTREKLRRILRSHTVISTLRKKLFKPKDRVTTEHSIETLFTKLAAVTAKQSTSVNLNGL